MRADRLISILLLLQIHGQMSGRELAKRLEVSPRTIHRDMEVLSASGVPVYAVHGTRGGWTLDPAYRTNLTGLNPSEAQALALTLPTQLLVDLGLEGASQAAYYKFLAALPTANRDSAEFIRQRFYVDMSGWQQYKEPAPFLALIQDALWQEKRLQMVYKRNDGTLVDRCVEPLGLVAKGAVWYLVASIEGEARTYRASRIQSARIESQTAQRPPGFDLAAFWQKSTSEFRSTLPQYQVTVRLGPGILERLRYAGRYTRLDKVELVGEPDVMGWQTARIQFEREREASEYLLSFGPQIEVLDPPDLRSSLLAQAQEVVKIYAKPEN